MAKKKKSAKSAKKSARTSGRTAAAKKRTSGRSPAKRKSGRTSARGKAATRKSGRTRAASSGRVAARKATPPPAEKQESVSMETGDATEAPLTAGSRFVVGIDLGTTNCAIGWADTRAEGGPAVSVLPVPQLIRPGVAEERQLLPSFLFIPPVEEDPTYGIERPWTDGRVLTVGEMARLRGAEVPNRLIGSAKSWLGHGAVDRRGSILPWGAGDEVPRISPEDAATFILEHIRDAWNEHFEDEGDEARLEVQEVVLTVPASFDAVARDLTVAAARRAGFENLTLLEEPQAAFYAWLARQGEGWRNQVQPGDLVLVCDVGGGTSDFTLVSVSEDGGNLILERTAVGEHLLLGGDNMDLALAHVASMKLEEAGHDLDPWQSRALWYACRNAKEKLLVDPDRESEPVAIVGRGSRLVGGTIKTDLTQDEMRRVILDGFFPTCTSEDRPARDRRGGFAEMGLPFAADAAITKHLAKFVGSAPEERMPTALLLNGGVFRGTPLQERLAEVLNGWAGEYETEDGEAHQVKVLEGADLDLAVARGAASYGLVRRGQGIRIRGGTARSYYIGVESAMPAVPGMEPPLKLCCVAPVGMEEGTRTELPDREFGLVVGEPVLFRFFGSSSRHEDLPGSMVTGRAARDIDELAPLETVLRPEGTNLEDSQLDEPDPDELGDAAGNQIPVRLRTHVTEIGTLEVWAVERGGERAWKLEWNVREGGDEDQE